MVDLSVQIGSVTLPNPVMAGSGCMGEVLADVIDLNLLGALVAKSIRLDIREGNPPPRVVELRDAALFNIGIPSKGPDYFVANVIPFYKKYAPPFVVSISADYAAEYGVLAQKIDVDGVDVIEINVSSPNNAADGLAFGQDPKATFDVVSAVRKVSDKPLWAKLTCNTGDITVICRAAEEAGADALIVANTVPGMAIDVESWKPKLGGITGGFTGAGVKPMHLRFVWQAARATRLPLIGTGGIETGEDVAEFMLAGASAVQIGTANFRSASAMPKAIEGLRRYCARKGIASARELIRGIIVGEKQPLREMDRRE